MEKTRIQWIDYAKALAIFCVVLLHANVPYPAKGLIRVWVIPLFFFLSGIFARTYRYATFRDFFIQKGLHILIPYICFNIINYLFWFILGRHYGYDADAETIWWKPLWGILYGEYSHLTHYIPLWFLACLLTTETLFYLIFRHIKSNKSYWIATLIIALIGGMNYYLNPIALPWGLGIAFPMMVFYSAGNFFYNQIINTYRPLRLHYTLLLQIISIVLVIIVYHYNSGEVLVFSNQYGNYLLFYIGAFAGIGCMYSICRLLETFLAQYLTWLSFIGRNTLIILCLHLNVFSIIKGFTYFICRLPLDIFSQTWIIIVSSILNIIILIPIINVINRFFPFLIGKFSTNEKHF